MRRQPVSETTLELNPPFQDVRQNSEKEFNYSVTWLFINILLIVSSFILLNRCTWIVWSIVISGIVIIWSLRYQRALHQLSKPKFWILFVLITLITAFVFTKVRTGENSLFQGILTGIQMNFRAVIIIVGFSVLGTELYNPVVRKFFLRTSFRNLPLALELSAESLPLFIANIPDFKNLVRNPVSVFYQVLSHADRKFSEIREKSALDREVFIITGTIRGGKTTFTKKLIEFLNTSNVATGGIISERIMNGSHTTGYYIADIETGRKEEFLKQNGAEGDGRIGRFTICKRGLSMGIEILNSLVNHNRKLIIIDEVGLLEIQDKGWSEGINTLLRNSSNHILMTVRDIYVDEVIRKWDLGEAVIFNISETDHLAAGRSVIEQIGSNPAVVKKIIRYHQ